MQGCSSKGSVGRDTKEEKKVERVEFRVFRKTERENTGESRLS